MYCTMYKHVYNTPKIPIVVRYDADIYEDLYIELIQIKNYCGGRHL